jgi:hypothetical protein
VVCGNLKGKGLNQLANSSAQPLVYTVRPNHERTLAHENIRKQGKFPNIAEISLGEENARIALDAHFFPEGRLLSI